MRALYRWLVAWFLKVSEGGALWRWALLAGAGVLLGLCALGLWGAVRGGRASAVLVRLDGAMAGAAGQNTVDAIAVVQARALSEQTMERTVSHAQSAINAASDAAGADAAGRDGLCAVAAGFCAATGVQQPGAR
jgi:hypothetical protein